MSADFWMGLGIGSLGPWVFMVVVFCAAGKGTAKNREHNEEVLRLMRERNALDKRKVGALDEIAEGRAE